MAIRAPGSAPTAAEAQLSAVLDTAPVGIAIFDEQGRILAFNKACERLFGYSAGEVVGSDASVLAPPEQAGAHQAWVAALKDGAGQSGAGHEVLGTHRDGTAIPLELAVGGLQAPDGPQVVAVMRDLRGDRAIERRLRETQDELQRLARVSLSDDVGAALAHELNQPLTALMLYLQAIHRAGHGKGTGSAFSPIIFDILARAMREAERAGNIVQGMRHFVANREPLRRLVEVGPLVNNAAELVLLGARPGIVITRNLASDLPRVSVDPIQIQQALVVVLRSSVEAAREFDHLDVLVTGRRDAGMVALNIFDAGIETRPQATDPLEALPQAAEDGIGLGLTIARRIAQSHGGNLTVDPGDDVRRACVTLCLPAAAPSNA